MRFALAGNPNCGKTTLFNALTGSTAHVGNWPGVTVDKREGSYRKKGVKIDVVDLPGIYSLSPYTPEEVVSRNFIIDEKPDVIVDVVDSTNLERNLYLTTQLLELDAPVIIALNMTDVLQKDKRKIDTEKLSEVFGVPVVEISALRGKGLDEMMRVAAKAADSPRKGVSFAGENSGISGLYRGAYALYEQAGVNNAAFRAVKALEGDELEKNKNPRIVEQIERLCEEGTDYEALVADARYKFISSRCKDAVSGKKQQVKLSKSDKIDRVLTHRIWGIPLFLIIMLAVFHLTFSEDFLYLGAMGAIPEIAEPTIWNDIFGNGAINAPGTILFNLMDIATSRLGEVIAGAMPEGTWYASLVNDGICGGVFSVLSFIPQILVLFLFLSILEDSGYMARVAFIMDRAFRKFGLSGKSFLPLLMCFGCAVPGIMATKTLEDPKERKMTILLAPFFSCGAKMPIWAAFGAILFGGSHRDLIVYGMYVLGIAVAIVSAILLKKFVFKGEASAFIMELPEYHRPQFRNTMVHLWQKLKHYLFRAATIIAGATVVIWFLTNISFTFRFVEDQGDSILGQIAKVFSWLFVPLGFGMGENGWMFVVAAFSGLIAKEMVVSTLGTFAGMEEDALEVEEGQLLSTALGTLVSGMAGGAPAAFAFMAFNLLSVPCMAAVGAAYGELRSGKQIWAAVGYWILVAYVVGALVFWIGTYWWISLILMALIAAAIGVKVYVDKNRKKKLSLGGGAAKSGD